jgi:hypothetical protein
MRVVDMLGVIKVGRIAIVMDILNAVDVVKVGKLVTLSRRSICSNHLT